MNGGLAMFAIGVIGLAAAAAVVAPASQPPEGNQISIPSAAPPPTVATGEAKPPPRPAPQPGGMISHSYGPGPVTHGKPLRPPPIVAIPRIPGPADMMVADDDRQLRTLHSFPSNEACDEALAEVRRTISNAFCVSTTPPPAPPEHGFLVEVDTARNEIVGFETHPSMAECGRVLAARSARPGIRRICTPKIH